MKHYEASATIEATPDQVWPVLVDAPAWSTWESGVVSVEGRIAEGEKVTGLRVVIHPLPEFPGGGWGGGPSESGHGRGASPARTDKPDDRAGTGEPSGDAPAKGTFPLRCVRSRCEWALTRPGTSVAAPSAIVSSASGAAIGRPAHATLPSRRRTAPGASTVSASGRTASAVRRRRTGLP